MRYDAEALATFGYELGLLKRIRRSGWWHAGVRDPESVAEHTMRTAQLAGLMAAEEGADPARAAFLALWHDTQETRTGDLPQTAGDYLTKPEPRQITADQTENLPERSREVIRAAVDEYEARQTLEALCAKDADKLDMLLLFPGATGEARCADCCATGGWSRGIRARERTWSPRPSRRELSPGR